MSCNGLLMFGLMGALFVLTQYLQFQLGYTPLQAGVRVLPAAGCIALVAPLSATIVRRLGTKLTVAAGLLVVAAGLLQLSQATVDSTYADTVVGMAMLGLGAGLVLPASVGAVMGALPRITWASGRARTAPSSRSAARSGSRSSGACSRPATNTTSPAPGRPASPAVVHRRSSGHSEQRSRSQRTSRARRADARTAFARGAFMSGMDLGMTVGAAVALAGAALALALLPSTAEDDDTDVPPSMPAPTRDTTPAASTGSR